jgi:hypothetical protein
MKQNEVVNRTGKIIILAAALVLSHLSSGSAQNVIAWGDNSELCIEE